MLNRAFFRSGAGVVAALAILFIFGVMSLCLKSLLFGIITAYFFLPLEKLFERLFKLKPVRRTCDFLRSLRYPFVRLREKISGVKRVLTEEEAIKEERSRLVFRSTLAMSLFLIAALVAILFISARLIIPAAMNAGRSVSAWLSESETLRAAESRISGMISEDGGMPGGQEEESIESEVFSFRQFMRDLRPRIKEYVNENPSEVAQFAFSKSRGLLGFLFGTASSIGVFAFDIILFFFFFLFFVMKMASFGGDGEKSDIGKWCVHSIYSSPWLPKPSGEVRDEAADIINSVAQMFRCWVRGYFSIVLIETALYLVCFTAFSVPYGIPLAFAAGMTIFLPFIGPMASYTLTALICLGFCESGVVVTLVGVTSTYLIINGILEQFLLYPKFIGNSLGLTTLETIIVVLLGGVLGGIAGMILAIPVAAILKFLVPKIYRIRMRDSVAEENA